MVILYFLANVAYIVTLPLDGIQHAANDRVGTATMLAILGDKGEAIMAAAILISTFGCVNGLVLAGARVYYAVARDGLFFQSVATTNRRHVPAAALVAQGVWASLLALPVTVITDPKTGKVSLRQDLQRIAGIRDPGRRYVLHADGRHRDRLEAQGTAPEPPLPNDRLPVPRLDLHRSGDSAGASTSFT